MRISDWSSDVCSSDLIDAAQWVDGNVTSGHQSALAKRNLQLPEDCAEAKQAGQIVLDGLRRSPLFIAAALPLKIFPPLLNSSAGGQAFGDRKGVGEGKRVSVRVDRGGGRNINKTN